MKNCGGGGGPGGPGGGGPGGPGGPVFGIPGILLHSKKFGSLLEKVTVPLQFIPLWV